MLVHARSAPRAEPQYRGRVIATNVKHLPLSIVALWGVLTLDDVEVMRQYYEVCHGRGGRFVSLVDARRSQAPGATIRRALADMSNTFEQQAARNTVCVVVVLDSKLLIGVLTALRWFLKTDADLRYFPTAADALASAEERLKAESLSVPLGARALIEKLDGDNVDLARVIGS